MTDKLAGAIKWMQTLQGPEDARITDQSKVQVVINAARSFHELRGKIEGMKRTPDIDDHICFCEICRDESDACRIHNAVLDDVLKMMEGE